MPPRGRRTSRDARILRSSGRRVAAAGALLAVALAVAPAAAQAASPLKVSTSFPAVTTVGQTLPASFTLTSESTFEDPSFTICKPGEDGPCAGRDGILLIPSCGQDAGTTCSASGADPGVIAVNEPAVGAQGTACAGVAFAATTVDATHGTLRFVPSGGVDVRLAAGEQCRVDFRFTVLRLPSRDARPDSGAQTAAIVTASARTYLSAPVAGGASTAYTVSPAPPAPPVLDRVDPTSPSSLNNPTVTGSAPAGTTVSLYASADCSGAPAAQGPAAAFTSPGLTVTVADNSATTFSAAVTDPATGLASACSAPSSRYVEDSAAPQTTITAGPTGTIDDDSPVFTFTSDDPGAGFSCRVDAAAFRTCISPLQLPALSGGPHTFEVRATDGLANVDPTPAARSFQIATGFRAASLSGCTLQGNAITGTPDNDSLRGTALTDVVAGLTGSDLLRGLDGRDCLFGQGGTDRVAGGTGADVLYGGTDNDNLTGDSGNDRLSGEAGIDRLDGGPGADRLLGGSGHDRLTDRRGADHASGGLGNDRIDARDRSASDRRARDRISCGAGRDTVLADPRDRIARDCEVVHRRSL